LAAAVSSIPSLKVAEEMLLCEVITSIRYAESTIRSSLLEGVQQGREKMFLWHGSRRTASIFKRIGLSAASWQTGWLTRERLEKMYTHRGEWTCRSLRPRHCLEMARLQQPGGDLDKAERGLSADNLRSYVRDSDPFSIGKKAVSYSLPCYNWEDWKRRAQSSFVPRSGGLLMISLARARSTLELTHEVGYAWLAFCNYVKHTACWACNIEHGHSLRAAGIYRRSRIHRGFEAYTQWALQLMC
jgi:hypothetical protein